MPLLLITLALVAVDDTSVDGPLAAFLGKPKFNMSQVATSQRFPNIVVATDGSLLALWGNDGVRLRRSEDAGASWGKPITIAENGFFTGGTVVDERTGHVLAFVEDRHPPAPFTVYVSKDHGESWSARPKGSVVIKPDANGHVPSLHMNESGLTLRRGKHAGRLIRAARWYAEANRRDQWPKHYTTAIFSDDRGKTWQTSQPFAEMGTGEAAIAELSDGTLYYNSRIHWQEARNPLRRRHAWSDDGGATWRDWQIVEVLPDGQQTRSYGCMGGLVRLPIQGRDVLIFSNLDTKNPRRERGTVWASFDGGRTWPVKRLVFDGPSAYSSLNAGRTNTNSAGWVYLHFEGGPKGGSHVARFNLAWLLGGEPTGDGEVPEWAIR